jgi:hypothetical protein
MFQKKANEKEYYFILDEYENNNQNGPIEV